MNGSARRPTILLLGGSGQIGFELRRELAGAGPVVAPGAAEADLRDGERLRALVADVRPAVIVNAAAYTAVDQAEAEPAVAEAINATAPGLLAEAAARAGVPIVHFSTDYVFDGQSGRPYTETDETCPLSVYGRTKLEGERRVTAAGCPHLIFRTSWVFGRRRRNFMLTMLGLARTREELAVVADQRGAPTSARLVAAAVGQIVGRALATEDPAATIGTWSGIYHLSAAGMTTWHGFAEAILQGDPRRSEQICRGIRPISTAEFPAAARRPANSVLDNAKVERTFGILLPDWREHLALTLAE